MEYKIGEIFEFGGEWYQCVKGDHCYNCSFYIDERCTNAYSLNGVCFDSSRSDNTEVIFKKLEKVGEPYDFQKRTFQTYKLHTTPFLSEDVELVAVPSKDNNTIEIEIKQTKEDMEENETPLPKEDNPLTRIVYAYVNGKISDNELIKSIKEMSDEYPYNKNNIKPFNLEQAKTGKPVCTRDGRKARIICFDRENEQPIVALIKDDEEEYIDTFFNNGHSVSKTNEVAGDLMMFPEKKERWMNVYCNKKGEYWSEQVLFSTKKDAADFVHDNAQYVTTVKVEWEE